MSEALAVGPISSWCRKTKDGWDVFSEEEEIWGTATPEEHALLDEIERLQSRPAGATLATTRQFTNELGNSITITISGPTSEVTNELTLQEATELSEALSKKLAAIAKATGAPDLQRRGGFHPAVKTAAQGRSQDNAVSRSRRRVSGRDADANDPLRR